MSALALRVTAVAVTILTASVITACSPAGPAAPSAAPPASATPPGTTPPSAAGPGPAASGTTPPPAATGTPAPLTDAELAWLAAFSKLARTINSQFAKSPQNQVMTRSNTLAMAAALRVCSHSLAQLGPPSQRLQPVYQAAQQACRQFDKAASCTQAAAGAVGAAAAPGSPAERELTQNMDCMTAGIVDGEKAMVEAQTKSIGIRAASGDL